MTAVVRPIQERWNLAHSVRPSIENAMEHFGGNIQGTYLMKYFLSPQQCLTYYTPEIGSLYQLDCSTNAKQA